MNSENNTNPKPVGFWDEMAQIVSEIDLNQSPAQTKPQPEKRLANNELVDVAYEAICHQQLKKWLLSMFNVMQTKRS
ncbi:hypothetical protein [Snodgrassella alvi]|uniref:Uncharacterized protein n=1 Tax=Snodgrassella alvi TaxID=1196083 RepID=A0A2N9XWK2_9NEIS|nr:hypothetical protein [Snodgrassella alvi]PIT54085.1 hypothetical protein BHC49_09055 [Snodgrassella alvi]